MSNEEFKKSYIEFAKPFIDSLINIYQTMLQVTVTPMKPNLKESNKSLGEYSAIMGISGSVKLASSSENFKGTLVVSWPLETYLKTASKMLGSDYTEINDEISDMGMEICNMTMGGAKKDLSEKGFSIDISIPTAIQGKDHVLYVEDKVVTVITPFESELGIFFVEVNFDLISS